jgi:hypothetical protein
VPVELPNYQNRQVRRYKKGTPVGDLIDTVLTTSEENDAKLSTDSPTPESTTPSSSTKLKNWSD